MKIKEVYFRVVFDPATAGKRPTYKAGRGKTFRVAVRNMALKSQNYFKNGEFEAIVREFEITDLTGIKPISSERSQPYGINEKKV